MIHKAVPLEAEVCPSGGTCTGEKQCKDDKSAHVKIIEIQL